MLEKEFCFWHDPESADAAAEARRLGGQRRKREGALAGAFELESIRTIDDLVRVLEIALFETLALANGVARNRTLIAIAQAASSLKEKSELEGRLAALELALAPRMRKGKR